MTLYILSGLSLIMLVFLVSIIIHLIYLEKTVASQAIIVEEVVSELFREHNTKMTRQDDELAKKKT